MQFIRSLHRKKDAAVVLHTNRIREHSLNSQHAGTLRCYWT